MNEVKILQNEVSEMAITLRELAVLEDGFGASYSEIVSDIRCIHGQLKNRLSVLQNSVNRRNWNE